jgi:tetraacyldisaccharide 4'-kinase
VAGPKSLDSLELYLLEVMNDTRKGIWPELLRGIAYGASLAYSIIVRTRLALYARGIFKTRKAPIPVISVGNLTVGGTGKTPFVTYLVRGLAGPDHRHRPAVLARGYRSGPSGKNDEMEMIEQSCSNTITVGNPNRLAGALTAHEKGADLAVLDDGFQHIALQRDLDILLIDATRPFGNGHLLPRGLLREPTENSRRADIVVLTRVDLAGLEQVGELRTWLNRLKPGIPVIESSFQPQELKALAENQNSKFSTPAELDGVRVAAFAGLANPNGFGQTLRSLGAKVVFSRRFPDHHHYSAADIETVVAESGAAGAEVLITTEKDAVKLNDLPAPDLPLYCLTIKTCIERGEELLWSEISKAVRNFKSD